MGHQAKKSFGQNFLQDSNIIRKIIDAIAPTEQDCLVEIGPGQAALTKPTYPLAKQLIAIELDNALIENLQRLAAESNGKLQIVHADALKTDLSTLAIERWPVKLFGNLPYNISTPLLFHCLEYADKISTMTFMLQKEVVDRIVAQPGSKQYGRLSIMTQYHAQAEALFEVSANCFFPKPKVTSAVVQLTPYKEKPFIAKDPTLFADIVRDAFNQRRKTLSNGLKKYLQVKPDVKLEVDTSLRPEQVSIAEFVRLANQLTD